MRIAIVEDEEMVRQQLTEYIDRFYEGDSHRYEIVYYTDGDEIVDEFQADYDLIFLDIQMKRMDGLKAAEKIRQMDENVFLVFVTNMANYAIKGYSVHAFDFILKPVNYLMMKPILQRIDTLVESKTKKFITLPTDKGLTRIDVSQIYYMETEDHIICIRTEKGEYRLRSTMKSMEETLEGYGFSRCNNCYLVNLNHVDRVDGSSVFVHGNELTISRPRRKAFMEALAKFLGGSSL